MHTKCRCARHKLLMNIHRNIDRWSSWTFRALLINRISWKLWRTFYSKKIFHSLSHLSVINDSFPFPRRLSPLPLRRRIFERLERWMPITKLHNLHINNIFYRSVELNFIYEWEKKLFTSIAKCTKTLPKRAEKAK